MKDQYKTISYKNNKTFNAGIKRYNKDIVDIDRHNRIIVIQIPTSKIIL
jgi:hypothetical protein